MKISTFGKKIVLFGALLSSATVFAASCPTGEWLHRDNISGYVIADGGWKSLFPVDESFIGPDMSFDSVQIFLTGNGKTKGSTLCTYNNLFFMQQQPGHVATVNPKDKSWKKVYLTKEHEQKQEADGYVCKSVSAENCQFTAMTDNANPSLR